MPLTPKQEAFARAYVETGNASEAYRRCYKADRMSDGAIFHEGCRLLDHPHVSAKVAELHAKVAVRHNITIEERINRYASLAKKAEEMDDIQSAIRAEDSITRITGWFAKERENDRMPLGDALAMVLERRKSGDAEGTVH